MADIFKIGDDSTCQSCTKIPTQGECVKCFSCKSVFHAICENTNNDNKVATKSMIATFLTPSTKDNFQFFCNTCLTKLENSMAESETERISTLEKNFYNMEAKLDEIKEILKNKETVKTSSPKSSNAVRSSIWLDKDKLETIKAPPAKSVLVVKKVEDQEKSVENQSIVETAIMNHNISVVESYKNRSGDLMVVCETEDTRNELKNLVTSCSDDIVMNTPREIRPAITIVGLPREYKKEEIINMLVVQNGYIKKFAVSNNIYDHIKIYVIRPLKNDASCFQVFADVSSVLREGFRHYKDKVTLGLTTCKIYDRYHIKRCYNCQNFGHYAKDCPTTNVHNCGMCSEDHQTKDCESLVHKCINCVRNNISDIHHTATSYKCPCLIKEQDLLKKKLNNERLNVMRRSNHPPR